MNDLELLQDMFRISAETELLICTVICLPETDAYLKGLPKAQTRPERSPRLLFGHLHNHFILFTVDKIIY